MGSEVTMKARLFRRIYRLLTPGERRKAVRVVLSLLAGTLLDFAGLALLLPLLYFLLGDGDHREAALRFGLLAVAFIALKCAATLALNRYRSRFLLSLYRRLSLSLYAAYYRRGLLFIRRQGVTRLGYEVNQLCYAFSQSLLAPLARLAGDGLLLLLAVVALILYSPLIAWVVAASFAPFIGVYVWGIRKRAKHYGTCEQAAKRRQQQLVTDTFGGYAEWKVYALFPRMRTVFHEGMVQIGNNRLKMETLMSLPMPLSEWAVVVGLVLLTALGSGDVKVLIGLFAVAAFRLLPAVRSLLTGWTQVQNALHTLEVLEAGLTGKVQAEPVCSIPLTFRHSLSVEHLTYAYPGGETVLRDVSFWVNKGEYVGICGYSGAGKTTLFNLLLGLLQPDAGEIRIDGTVLSPQLQPEWRKRIGYVPQEVYIFSGTLLDNIALEPDGADRERIIALLEQVYLKEWLDALPQGLDTVLDERGGQLSGGQRQRIGIARALYREADVLLLDEATSALDNDTERQVNDTLAALRTTHPSLTILSIAHRESSLAYCDRLLSLN